MKALYIISHNAVVVMDQKGRRCIVTGKGIGFMKKIGDLISPQIVERIFIEESNFRK